MSQNDLRNLLTQLHARLENVSSLDEEDRRLLTTVLADIDHALAQGDSAQPAAGAGLEALAVKFEADHPALAGTLRRLVDSLGKAGI
jgi:hypothetical protein